MVTKLQKQVNQSRLWDFSSAKQGILKPAKPAPEPKPAESKPAESTDPLYLEFLAFHKKNPFIYRMFRRFALEKARAGYKTFSARTIIERIRWETNVESSPENQFKINDHVAPYYSRLFMKDHPECKGFFVTRSLKAEKDGGSNGE
jgi:hypothetical protein